MFGHHVASFYLEDQETAIKFCKAGLISNPNDPQIINNIAHSIAVGNEPSKAFEYLNKVSVDDVSEDHSRICLSATTGLTFFRTGFSEMGRNLYLEAMKEAKNKRLTFYYYLALMNFTREEIRIESGESNKLFEMVSNIPENISREMSILKKRVIEQMKLKT